MKALSARKTVRLRADVGPYITDLLENINGGKTVLQVEKGATVFSLHD